MNIKYFISICISVTCNPIERHRETPANAALEAHEGLTAIHTPPRPLPDGDHGRVLPTRLHTGYSLWAARNDNLGAFGTF